MNAPLTQAQITAADRYALAGSMANSARCTCRNGHMSLANHREHAKALYAGKAIRSPFLSATEQQLADAYMHIFARCPLNRIEAQDEFFARYGQRRGDDKRVSA